MADQIAPCAYPTNANDAISRLKSCGVTFLAGRRLDKIEDGCLQLSRKNGILETIGVDVVVPVIDVRSCDTLSKELWHGRSVKAAHLIVFL